MRPPVRVVMYAPFTGRATHAHIVNDHPLLLADYLEDGDNYLERTLKLTKTIQRAAQMLFDTPPYSDDDSEKAADLWHLKFP